MVRAVILSAGQGRRLRPLTADKPKCLIALAGKSVLEWQLETLAAAGVAECSVVVGFGAEKVSETLSGLGAGAPRVETILNVDYDTSDNLVSCWVARAAMQDDFLLINGDTLFEPEVIDRLLASPAAPVTLAMARKANYDADDMKVRCDGTVLRRVGKELGPEEIDGESIGVLLFRGEGPQMFRDQLAAALERPGVERLYFLSAVNDLAQRGVVHTASVEGLQWAEIDFWADLEIAERLVANWPRRGTAPATARPLAASAK